MLKDATNKLSMLKYTSKRFSNAQSQLKETSKSLTIKEFSYTWYTIKGVNNYKIKQTFKTLEFLRHELSKKFLSILCAFIFERVRA